MMALNMLQRRVRPAVRLAPWAARAAWVSAALMLAFVMVLAWFYWSNWARYANAQAQIESRVLAHLSPSPTEENALIRDIGVPSSVLAPVLLRLELSGQLTRLAGGKLALS